MQYETELSPVDYTSEVCTVFSFYMFTSILLVQFSFQNNEIKQELFRIKLPFTTKLLITFMILFSSLFYTCSSKAENWNCYTLACPFFTVFDDISQSDFQMLWNDGASIPEKISSLVITRTTLDDLESKLGPMNKIHRIVRAIPDQLPDKTCAIIPTAELTPLMKQISLDHSLAPWDADFTPEDSLLTISTSKVPNFTREKATTLLMTGTTALARATAYKMMINGIDYPAEDILTVFQSSDLRHISNEASFWEYCPLPDFYNESLQLCSQKDYWKLFSRLGVQIIELTGNHLRDYDWKPFRATLDTLTEKGFMWFGGGYNEESAKEPLFIEHNGNRFAFVGCNVPGPEHVFATETLPGVSRCDFDALEQTIRELTEEGNIVIAGIQHYERYSRVPHPQQVIDFHRLSEAGAIVVSGSQAHYAQAIQPFTDRIIHYGLGNLFFDQMDNPIKGTTQELLDRHVFYDGKLLQTELITAKLTDYSRPQIMTNDERIRFLTEIFAVQVN